MDERNLRKRNFYFLLMLLVRRERVYICGRNLAPSSIIYCTQRTHKKTHAFESSCRPLPAFDSALLTRATAELKSALFWRVNASELRLACARRFFPHVRRRSGRSYCSARLWRRLKWMDIYLTMLAVVLLSILWNPNQINKHTLTQTNNKGH